MKIQGLPIDLDALSQSSQSTTRTLESNTAKATQTTKKSSSELQLSPLVQFAYTHELSEYSFTSDETYIGYRSSDNSMALRAHSSKNISMKQENITIEATFSAEALGLTAEDFEQIGGKPFEFYLSFQQSQLHVEQKISAKTVETTRTPEEILQDLAKALSSIMRKKGDKDISIKLDDEAIRSLLGDAKISGIFKEILELISLLNSLKLSEGKREKEEITLSGKGKPYLDYDESLTVEGEQTNVEIKFTILPPAAKQEALPESASTTDTSTGQEPIDISV